MIYMFKCPICGFITIRLFALKQHVRRNHTLDKCPVCNQKYTRLNQHFYYKSDIDHLLYCYLFSTYKLPHHTRLAIKKHLEVE
ncbi:zinc-finger domain protein [Sulfolobus spindle-shaped virus 7]|uniref:Zinc finger protein n=1 Tax=Sulfolobus spindle-shaped virus 7 TaxID=693628 RepID=D1GF72_9VIRU|nr:zinc-finger domain protein [Sulfolobus spindle-shaped virus 7]ACZ35772.1 zinc finger protein [Sulfolobus spindle-shaped virus 7]